MTKDDALHLLDALIATLPESPTRLAVTLARASLLHDRTWRETLVEQFPDGIPDDYHLPGADF